MGNTERSKYCSNCGKHTPHQFVPEFYATVCLNCGTHTSELMRAQAEAAANALVAPDGTPAQVLENTPDDVTFYIPEGEYAGYYRHDKRTGNKEISASSLKKR